MVDIPGWLETWAIISLSSAGACSLVVVADILAGHRQHMWIMNVVWPITALYSGPIGLYAYFKIGRLATRQNMRAAMEKNEMPPSKRKPFWQTVATSTTHCGAGCTLGDICAEWILFIAPLMLWGEKIFAAWFLDYGLAFIFGIAFQYFTIKPMKHLPPGKALIAALKADSLSLTAWQAGMYGWMALATFGIFGHELEKTDPVFWFMMQIAMCAGFFTSFPANWWLVRKGIKEKM